MGKNRPSRKYTVYFKSKLSGKGKETGNPIEEQMYVASIVTGPAEREQRTTEEVNRERLELVPSL